MIHGHGDDAFRYVGKIRINFSANIYQGIDHSKLRSHLYALGDVFRNYPEPEPRSIETLLANRMGIDPECVIVTNGATESIYLLAQLKHDGLSAVCSPTFSEYQDACHIFHHRVVHFRSLDEIPADSSCVWICNPNNPTGKVTDRQSLIKLIDGNPDKLFIVDQAYADYTLKRVLDVKDAACRHNLILLSSLTKRYAIPGLRIGYAIGNAAIISQLRAMRMPWSVNSLAIEAARYLLSHDEDYVIDSRRLHEEALRISSTFSAIGIKVTDTDCNFLLAELPSSSALSLKNRLIDRHGILIRDASNFHGLGARHFRVAAQSPEENDILINALKEWNTL